MTTNCERIKAMSVEEMGKELTILQCSECGYASHDSCTQDGCWCHQSQGYKTYIDWLNRESEAENEV